MALSVISDTIKGYLNKMNQAAYRSLLGTALQNTQNFLTTTNAQAKAGTADKAVLASNMRQGGATPAAGTSEVVFAQYYKIATPANASATGVHAAITLTTATQAVTTAITNPDFPRLVVVVSNAAITTKVTIKGTDISGAAVSEELTLNGTTPVPSTIAFATVTEIDLPIRTNSGDTVSVGTLNKFGLPHIVPTANHLIKSLFNASADAGTLTVNAALNKNVYEVAGTPDGAKAVELFYYV